MANEELRMLQPLSSPFEIFDVKDGESIEFVPIRWERGRAIIYPKYLPAGTAKEIPVIRVYTTEQWKPVFPQYWDLTAKTLQAQLLPYLEQPGYRNFRYKITKHGVAPTARFTLEIVPYP